MDQAVLAQQRDDMGHAASIFASLLRQCANSPRRASRHEQDQHLSSQIVQLASTVGKPAPLVFLTKVEDCRLVDSQGA
jgi:hypothetical protein